jgi:hypothetical protein
MRLLVIDGGNKENQQGGDRQGPQKGRQVLLQPRQVLVSDATNKQTDVTEHKMRTQKQ